MKTPKETTRRRLMSVVLGGVMVLTVLGFSCPASGGWCPPGGGQGGSIKV